MQSKIIFYFIIYSFLGWCLESIYKTIIFKKPVNSGFLYGPFCPIYGMGAIIMIIASKESNNIFIIFLIGLVIFTIWEYLVAVILEKLFKTKYWDYSNIKYNFQGRICLKNSIYWGILGVVLMFIIQPNMSAFVSKIPQDIILYINIILCLTIIVDANITAFKIMFIDKKINQVFEIGEKIKEKLLEIKNTDNIEKSYKDSLNKAIKELKTKQYILKIKIYKRIIRLKKAFPEMNSENLTKFMKEKISVDKLRDKLKNMKKN